MLSGGSPVGVELEAQLLTTPYEAMPACLQTDPVDLEAVTQPRLRDSSAVLQLVGELEHLVMEVLGQIRAEPRGDTAQQDAAEARSRIDRQGQAAEGDTPRWSDRTRQVGLELGQEHATRYRPPGRRTQRAGLTP